MTQTPTAAPTTEKQSIVDFLIQTIKEQIQERDAAELRISQIKVERNALAATIEAATERKKQLLANDSEDITEIGKNLSELSHTIEAGNARYQRLGERMREDEEMLARLRTVHKDTTRGPFSKLPSFRQFERAQRIARCVGEVLDTNAIEARGARGATAFELKKSIYNMVAFDPSLEAPELPTAEACLAYIEKNRSDIEGAEAAHGRLSDLYRNAGARDLPRIQVQHNTDYPFLNLTFEASKP